MSQHTHSEEYSPYISTKPALFKLNPGTLVLLLHALNILPISTGYFLELGISHLEVTEKLKKHLSWVF